MRRAVAILVILCGGCCCGELPTTPASSTATTATSNDPAPPVNIDRTVEAKEHAETYVKQFLNHPNDAEFSWFPSVSQNASGTWMVTGTVKAQNSFGAKFTHEYQVALRIDESGEAPVWKCNAVHLDGKTVYVDESLAAELVAAAEEASRAEREEAARIARTRTFTDKTGEFSVDAEFVEFKVDKGVSTVFLKKADDTTIGVPMNRLSDDDQKWVREYLKSR